VPSRIVRDGILTSDPVNQLGWTGEVFYRRLMSVVDDFGRYDGRPSVLRAVLYPLKLDKVSESDVVKWTQEAAEAGLVRRYTVEGKPFIEIVKFDQRVQQKRSKWPAPSGESPEPTVGHGDSPPSLEASSVLEVKKDLSGKPDRADDFSTWYKAYPRHEARDDAQKAWDKRRKAGELPPLAFMLAQIEWQVREGCLKPATADGRSLVPLPATYLNKGKFKDEPPRTYVAPPRKFTPCTTDGCVGEGLVVWGGKCQVCYIQSKPRVAA